MKSKLIFHSYSVASSSGVKQGDPLGPIIFCMATHEITLKFKQLFPGIDVVGFLGKLKKLFEENEIEDDQIENFYETHLILNADTGRTLAPRGSHHIKYLDVVSGTIGFTMVVRLTGGRTGRIAPTMIIFKGNTEGAQIRGLQDDVINISYTTSKSAFMAQNVLSQYFSNRKLNRADRFGRTRLIFCDNAPSHRSTDAIKEALSDISAKLIYLPQIQLTYCNLQIASLSNKSRESG
ncbi:hypothetical protein RCL1_004607 [Eukaryota sp. TZLM3-RCL]